MVTKLNIYYYLTGGITKQKLIELHALQCAWSSEDEQQIDMTGIAQR